MSLPAVDDIEALTRFADALADVAARETLPRFRAEVPVENKDAVGFDPVTDADRGAEAAMRAAIAEAFPDHGVIGEEHEDVPAKGPWTWTLDPVDGTRSFIIGLPLWATLIAASYEGRPVIGVIDQPYLGERYFGADGDAWAVIRGARVPLRTRACPRLTGAVVSVTDPLTMFDAAEFAAFEQVRAAARLTRYGADAYAYAQLAAGRIDLVIESGLQTYDVAALAPVIEGAGGELTDWRGACGPALKGGQVIACGDAAARDEALVALRRAATTG